MFLSTTFFFFQKQRTQSQLVNRTDNLNMMVKDSFAVTTKIQPSSLTGSIYPVSSMNTIKPLFFLETVMASSHWKSWNILCVGQRKKSTVHPATATADIKGQLQTYSNHYVK